MASTVFAQQSDSKTTTAGIELNNVSTSTSAKSADRPHQSGSSTATTATPTVAASKTSWKNLNQEEKNALAPLASEWDKMDATRQKKWLGVSHKYSNMKPEEQQRVQERIKTWVQMTPEQRMSVRENFANTAKKSPEQKSAQWQQYQQLSEEEKMKFADQAKTKKSITTIQPESKRTTPVLAPIKKGPPLANPASASASQASIK
jgi:molecular chaperone GrpE (heat shock protein)